jgi:lipid-binding SYLF domain-containing protein
LQRPNGFETKYLGGSKELVQSSKYEIERVGMKKNLIAVLLCLTTTVPVVAQKASQRLADSTAVLKTIITKNDIPKDVLNKARCVIVYPGVRKVGVGLGVSYGRGVMVCRSGAEMDGKWAAPIMYTLDTGSLGVQLGSSPPIMFFWS